METEKREAFKLVADFIVGTLQMPTLLNKQAKQCSLICCDKIIEQYIDENCETVRFYKKVKEEINNL